MERMVKAMFEQHLVEVREDYPVATTKDQYDMAFERTMNDLRSELIRVVDARYWEHIDTVNKYHYA